MAHEVSTVHNFMLKYICGMNNFVVKMIKGIKRNYCKLSQKCWPNYDEKFVNLVEFL